MPTKLAKFWTLDIEIQPRALGPNFGPWTNLQWHNRWAIPANLLGLFSSPLLLQLRPCFSDDSQFSSLHYMEIHFDINYLFLVPQPYITPISKFQFHWRWLTKRDWTDEFWVWSFGHCVEKMSELEFSWPSSAFSYCSNGIVGWILLKCKRFKEDYLTCDLLIS